MRRYSFLTGLIAISLGVTTSRTDGESLSDHTGQRMTSNVIHAVKIHSDQDCLVEDIKTCDQFLNVITEFAPEINDTISSRWSAVEACKRIIHAVDIALENDPQNHIYLCYEHNLQIPLRFDRVCPEKTSITQTIVSQIDYKRETLSDSYDSSQSSRSHTKHQSQRTRRGEEVCEDKVCENEHLEEMCNSDDLEPSTALTCKMCYPERNARLINAHCQAKWRRERRAFYVVSFILIAITLISGFILYVRRRYLKMKNPQGDEFQNSNPEINPPGEIYYYDGARSVMPSERENTPQITPSYSPESRQNRGSKRYHSSWDYSDDDVISTSAAQRRLRQLGIISRTGRKRIHDLFDLEALRSKHDTKTVRRQSQDTDRIPVMPWAPNASVRLNDRESQRVQPGKLSKSSSEIELQEVPQSDAV